MMIARGPMALRNMQSVVVRVEGVTELERYWNLDGACLVNWFTPRVGRRW
jgi:hypothetical protein